MGASASKESLSTQVVQNKLEISAPTSVRQTEEASPSSRCPVPDNYRNPAIYNVYGQRINDPAQQSCPSPLSALQGSDLLDPKNNMPLEANQQPCPGQRKPLSIERIQSTIPKGGTDATWLYPSPQMFYNGEQQQQQQGADNGSTCLEPSSMSALLMLNRTDFRGYTSPG